MKFIIKSVSDSFNEDEEFYYKDIISNLKKEYYLVEGKNTVSRSSDIILWQEPSEKWPERWINFKAKRVMWTAEFNSIEEILEVAKIDTNGVLISWDEEQQMFALKIYDDYME